MGIQEIMNKRKPADWSLVEKNIAEGKVTPVSRMDAATARKAARVAPPEQIGKESRTGGGRVAKPPARR